MICTKLAGNKSSDTKTRDNELEKTPEDIPQAVVEEPCFEIVLGEDDEEVGFGREELKVQLPEK